MPHFHEQIFYIEEAAALTLNTLNAGIGRVNPIGVNLVSDGVDYFVELLGHTRRESFHMADA